MHHAWQTTNFFSAFIRILALVGLRVNSVLTYRFIIFYDNSRFYIYIIWINEWTGLGALVGTQFENAQLGTVAAARAIQLGIYSV